MPIRWVMASLEFDLIEYFLLSSTTDIFRTLPQIDSTRHIWINYIPVLMNNFQNPADRGFALDILNLQWATSDI